MADDITEFDQLLVDFRQLRTSTAMYMETYAIHNRLIQLTSVISNQLFISLFTFVGVVLAFVNVVLVVQQITTTLLIVSMGSSAAVLLVFLWLYRAQLKERVEDQESLLGNEIARLKDGESLYSAIQITIKEALVPAVDRLVNEGAINQPNAATLKERFSGATEWIDTHLEKLRKEKLEDEAKLRRLTGNV